MDIKDYKDIYDILFELQSEFDTEEAKLKDISKSCSVKIDELEQQIYTARKNEDIDFRVFSPRNISKDNSEKINLLESEKSSLEKEKKDADRQMFYYTGKSEKLEKAILILKRNMDIDFEEDINKKKIDTANEEYDVLNLFNNDSDSINDNVIKNINYQNTTIVNSDEVNDENDIFSLFNSNDSNNELDENTVKTESSDLYNSSIVNDNTNNISNDSNNTDKISSKNNDISVDLSIEEFKRNISNQVDKLCRKLEFINKIINNDRVRAKIQIREVINDLRNLIN